MSTVNARPTPRIRMSREARREQLLELGFQMAQGQALETITMEAVADAAGVSRGLIFHYFESKGDFHLAVVRKLADRLVERTAPREDLDDPIAVLTESMAAYIDYVSGNRDGYLGLLRGSRSNDPEIREVADGTRAVLIDRIMAYGPDLGLTASPAVEVAVAGWIAFVEETMLRWLYEPVISRDELLSMLVTALPALAGMADAITGPDADA
ncbi:TetR/AcrR family transcriptional regulator [Gordonia shandongensis]|uniref:TetR/AcrR family transcriptional regulator n=1 Tax=Gordonia shandongensis TaxID=376351 RepID=UPI0004157094|nr:TetR/AcrR family transcriptional regulator [Gordonia shandongensis]